MAHAQALAQHQETLAANIEKDLKALGNKLPHDQPAGNLSIR
jgi:hypothetical protein